MFKCILLPLDRSAIAEHAIGPAAAIARGAGASIEVVMVHESYPFGDYTGLSERRENEVRDEAYLESISGELGSGAGVKATPALLHGSAADIISERAKHVSADLIVMTSHGRTGLSRFWLGSVADGVVRRSPCPVLVVPISEKSPSARRAAPSVFKRMLIPLDGSAFAATIMTAALQFARATGASVSLLRIVPFVPLAVTMPPDGSWSNVPIMQDEPATRHLVDEALREMRQVAARISEEHGTPVEPHVLPGWSSAEGIIAFAQSRAIDVIAMSTHGRGASRVFLGSVADKVLRAGGFPVLLQRPSVIPEPPPLLNEGSVAEQLSTLSP